MEDRIAVGVVIEAKLREFDRAAIPYYIVNKGAYFSGTIVLKLYTAGKGSRVLIQVRNEAGLLDWMNALKEEWVAEAQADDYIRRAIDRDPDIWAIEVECRTGINPFEGQFF